jgi:hypothetical protein
VQYPKAKKMVAYGEFRSGYNKDKQDMRIVAYGIRYLIENYIAKPWSMRDVDLAEAFYSRHMAPGYTEFPFPRHLFEKIVTENRGYFPVTIEAISEGTCMHVRIPMYQVSSTVLNQGLSTHTPNVTCSLCTDYCCRGVLPPLHFPGDTADHDLVPYHRGHAQSSCKGRSGGLFC